jgi:hypothetical protein
VNFKLSFDNDGTLLHNATVVQYRNSEKRKRICKLDDQKNKKKKKKPELRGDGLASSVVISRKDAKTGRGGDADVGRVNRKVRRSSGGSDADVKAR